MARITLRVEDDAINPVYLPLYADDARYLVMYGGASSGKCLGKGTKIIMFDGSLKNVEDVKTGDQLMGVDSKPRNVLATSKGYGKLYRVIQAKGKDYIVNESHQLSLIKSKDAKRPTDLQKSGRYRRPNGRYGATPDRINIEVKDWLLKSKRFKRDFYGWRVGVDFPERDVKVDPYFLGLWLGDGCKNKTSITSADKEIVDYLYQYADKLGLKVSIDHKKDNEASAYCISNGYGEVSNLRKWMIGYNLIGRKHIPDDYLYNSKEVRLAVLAGIIDTDGYSYSGCFEVTQKDFNLAKQITYLANSLGLRCSLNECKKSIKSIGFEGTYYRMTISGDTSIIPTKIERKIIRHKRIRCADSCQIKIEPFGDGEFFGFELDGDKLFLLEDFTVTHNSDYAAFKFLMRCATEPKRRMYCIRKVERTIRNSQFKLLKDEIIRYGLQDIFEIRETTMSLKHRYNDNEILSLGLDSREKIKSLTEPTDFWLEEPTEFEERDITQLDYRLRGYNPTYKQIMFTFNPISELHFLKPKFFSPFVEQQLEKSNYASYEIKTKVEKEEFTSRVSICKTTYKDNIFLPIEDKAVLESYKEIDPLYYSIYCLGNWGSIGNLVYSKPFPIEEKFPSEFDEVIYGLDFGYQHPTALIKVGIRDDQYYVYEKFCERKLQLKDIIEKLYEEIDNKNDVIYADSADPEKISEIESAGFNIYPAVKGNFSVGNGVDFIKSCKVHSHIDNVTLNKEVKTYKWKEDTLGKPIEGEVVKLNDDCLDAMRYAIYSHSKREIVNYAFIG